MNRAEARIDPAAIVHNIKLLKNKAGTKLLAVVKADAYGHGLIETSRIALSAGADWLGVALLEEALTLREARITTPILAWLLPPGSNFKGAIEANIDLGVSSIKAFHEIVATGLRARIHIELDTGMTRGGFRAEWQEFTESDFSEVDVIGAFSHFARADEPNEKQNQDQLDRFNEMVSELSVKPELLHLANSAATLMNPNGAFDLVRTGIAMYGLSPNVKTLGSHTELALKPAMQLRARLHLVKRVAAGSPVGYGASVVTSHETTLGVVAIGYGDGIPRIAHGAGVFIAGKRAPIIGRVSMDQFVVDLGVNSPAQSGDWVVIFGDGSHGEYTADDWGLASGSINYEIVTRIGPRVPRLYGTHVY